MTSSQAAESGTTIPSEPLRISQATTGLPPPPIAGQPLMRALPGTGPAPSQLMTPLPALPGRAPAPTAEQVTQPLPGTGSIATVPSAPRDAPTGAAEEDESGEQRRNPTRARGPLAPWPEGTGFVPPLALDPYGPHPYGRYPYPYGLHSYGPYPYGASPTVAYPYGHALYAPYPHVAPLRSWLYLAPGYVPPTDPYRRPHDAEITTPAAPR